MQQEALKVNERTFFSSWRSQHNICKHNFCVKCWDFERGWKRLQPRTSSVFRDYFHRTTPKVKDHVKFCYVRGHLNLLDCFVLRRRNICWRIHSQQFIMSETRRSMLIFAPIHQKCLQRKKSERLILSKVKYCLKRDFFN